MQAVLPSPEFSLLRDCCRAWFAGTVERTIEVPSTIDWNLLLLLARKHRVEGLVSRALRGNSLVPEPARGELASLGAKIAEHNLRCAGESVRLVTAFEQAAVPLAFVKGLPLGKMAYRDPFVKRAIDIDLLVEPGRIKQAAAILLELDYAPVPPIRADRIERWHRRSKESAWVRADGMQVDLHGRLIDSDRLLAGVDFTGAECMSSIMPNVEIRTIGGTPLLAYLAVHGAASSWFRLKWLADFAGLLSSMTPEAIAAVEQECRNTGAELAVTLALQLSHELFGTPPPSGQAKRSIRREALLRLFRSSLFSTREPTERPFGTLGIHLGQLLVASSPKAIWEEGARQVGHALQARGLR